MDGVRGLKSSQTPKTRSQVYAQFFFILTNIFKVKKKYVPQRNVFYHLLVLVPLIQLVLALYLMY